MRRVWAVVLIAVGIFALALAILMPTVGVSRAKKTPLDLDITQISSGPAKLLNSQTGKLDDVQLRATRKVASDSHASDGTNTTVNESLCIVVIKGETPNCVPASDARLLSVSTDRVTTNRRTGEAVTVAKWNDNVNGDTSIKHSGLAYKWPIDAQKKTYQFFEPDVGKAFPATYEGTSTVRGLKVYKYVSETGSQPYKVQGTFDGTYDDTRTVWVEPRTGAIVNGTEHQVQTINLSGGKAQTALDTTLSFEDSAIDYQSDYAKGKINQLRWAQLWAPIICGVVALGAFVGAFFLLRRRGPKEPTGRHGEPGPDDGPPPNPDDNYDSDLVFRGSSQT